MSCRRDEGRLNTVVSAGYFFLGNGLRGIHDPEPPRYNAVGRTKKDVHDASSPARSTAPTKSMFGKSIRSAKPCLYKPQGSWRGARTHGPLESLQIPMTISAGTCVNRADGRVVAQ